MVHVKFFENSTLLSLEGYVDEFLDGIDEKDFINVKITMARKDNVTPSSYYLAMVVFRQTIKDGSK